MTEGVDKLSEGTVVGLFHLRGKYTARELVKPQVVGYTITALALS